VELVEDGDLNVYQKGKFLAERRQGSVSICVLCVSKSLQMAVVAYPLWFRAGR
jgi:hypothetical protein